MITHILLAILLAIILGPALVSSGGIMLLDYTLSDVPLYGFDRPLGSMLSQMFGDLFGYAIGSKLVILAIHIFAGYLGILFARYFAKEWKVREKGSIYLLEVLGMIFFLTNPFAYERMMTQPLIYAGIIALGYGIYFQVFRERYIRAGFAYAFALALFPHASYMIALIFSLSFILFFRRMRWRDAFAMILPIVLLNLNWIVVTLIYNPLFTENISEFTVDNLRAFATQAIEPLNVFFTSLLLYGFWGEQFDNHFAHVSFMSPYWYVAGGIVFSLVLAGGTMLYQIGKKRELLFFIVLSVIALIFAVGRAHPWTDIVRRALTMIFPYWDGYREPGKWTGLIVISEGVLLLALFASVLKMQVRNIFVASTFVIFLITTIYVWSPGVYIAYRNQMRTSVIPEEYFLAREVMRNEPTVEKVLLLPWHMYIGCDWISRPSVANPSVAFFREFPLLTSENIDVGTILEKNEFTRKESSDIEEFLETYDIELLRKNNVSHIIFMKYCYGSEETAEYLDLLSELGDIEPLLERDSINIYIIP